MKYLIACAALLCGCAVTKPVTTVEPSVKCAPTKIDVHFSPKAGCTDAVVAFIAGAKKTVHLQAYSFTSQPIAEALVAAHGRGVKVTVVLDRSDRTGRGTMLSVLVDAGIDVRVDEKHAIAHNKLVMVDGVRVETGSFNFTVSAEDKNAENCLTIEDAELTRKYEANFDVHYNHSVDP